MRVLLGCEETQEVCKAFRKRGHKAFSCDLLPCSGGHPEWHIQCDVIDVIDLLDWNLIIGFPPCTDIAVSGAKHFEKKRANGSQRKSIEFFLAIAKHCNCLENPIGIMSGDYLEKHYPDLYEKAKLIGYPRKADQIIQPWQFGDPFTKTTCLWLKDLPLLKPTNIVDKGERHVTKSGKSLPKWYHDAKSGKEWGKVRSKTYPGIAEAMADQWG